MNCQKKIGYETTLGSIGKITDPQKAIEKKAYEEGLKVELFRMKNNLNLSEAIRIIKYAQNNKIDIIHCHGYKANIIIGLLSFNHRKIPYVCTLHGWTSTNKFTKLRIYEFIDIFMMKYANRVVAVSKAMLNDKRLINKNIDPVVIYNGIPVVEELNECNSIYWRNSNNDDVINIASIGRLSKEKGYDILIRSIYYIKTKYNYDIKLSIFGEGPEQYKLYKLTKELNVENNVVFKGYIPDAYKFLKIFDIFVLSSLTEGMPITLLEAMRIGIPIVATAVGGIPEALEHGKCGILVSPGCEIALANGIMRMYGDNSMKNMLSNESIKQFHQIFTVGKMEERYRTVYESSINEFKSL